MALTIEPRRVATYYFGPGTEVVHVASVGEIRAALGPEFGLEVPVTIVAGHDGRILRGVWGQVANSDLADLRDALGSADLR